MVKIPEFEVSIALKASRIDLKSMSMFKLFTRNFSVSFCRVFGARKSFNFFTMDSVTWWGVMPTFSLLTQECSRHYELVILVFGFLSSMRVIRSLASAVMFSQSLGSNLSFYVFTLWKISFTLSPSKGGYPHSTM